MGLPRPDRRVVRFMALAALAVLVTGCGSQAKGSPSSATGSAAAVSSSASTSALTTGTPVAVPSPRAASQAELAAMIAAGKGPAEHDLGLGDGASCTDHHQCLFTNQASGTIGTQAGFFHGNEGCPDGCGGAGCWVYLYQQGTDWHYVNAECAQSPGMVPGQDSIVYVSGCANVRATPGSSGKVVACLPNGTHVNVEGGPLYTDGKIWWHLQDRGWMAHDFLVAPKGSPSPS